MELPGLYTTKRELRRLENFRHARYKNRDIKYNTKLIEYRGVASRIENIRIACGDQVFIQTPQNCIFATQDMRDLRMLGMGEILGASGSFMIFRREQAYHLCSSGIVIAICFYLEDDKLLYKPASDLHEEAVHDPVQMSLVYKGYFIVQSERNVLFINLGCTTDVQFRFPGKILSTRHITGNAECVLVRYVAEAELDALFYHDRLISQNLRVTEHHGQYMVETVQGFGRESISQFHKKNKLDGCAPGLQFCTDVSNEDSVPCPSTPDKADAQSMFLANLVTSSHRTHGDASKREDKLFGAVVLGNFSPLEEKLFRYLNLDEQVLFLRSHVEEGGRDIVASHLSIIVHRLESVESLLTEENMKKHEHVLSSLGIYDFNVFFYLNPDLDAVLKSKCFLFRQPFTKEEMELLSRRYSRIFRFDPTIKESKNLAYTIIRCETRYKRNKVCVLSAMLDNKRAFNKLFRSYFGDIRIEDVIHFMLECNIAIQTDVNDVAGSRQDAFLLRSYSNIGCFIMNLGCTYCDGYIRDPPRINSTRVDDKVSQDLVFLNGACLFAFYRSASMGIHYELGTAFGSGLAKGLTDEDTQKYLKMAEDADEKMMRHLLLVISTRSNDSTRRSVSINGILKSRVESLDMGLRQATLCALAIYNTSTNDRYVLEILINECKRFGPTSLEKNSCFYNREYRTLSAVCCGLVATKPMSIALDDSFCELLANGLSSIDTGCPIERFYRTDDCRPQEIFYSQLFGLVCDFSASVSTVIQDIVLKDAMSAAEISRMSAKIFYIALKSLKEKNEDSVCDWLFDLAERVEEALERNRDMHTVFTLVLASLSIVKSGTCDLKLLRILRRQILRTKDLRHMADHEFFDHAAKNKVTIKGCSYECMQMYKICVGMVCSDFGMSRTAADVKQLIVTFFVHGTIPLRFSYLDILRMLIVRSFEPNQETLKSLRRHAAEIDLGARRKRLCRLFKTTFPTLNILDKKAVVDILSDYYENYHMGKRTVFDLQILARLVAICK